MLACRGLSFALHSFNPTSSPLLLLLSHPVDRDAAGVLPVPVYYC